jgi:hypothetical protein
VPEEPLSEERWAFERSMREREMALAERRLEHEMFAGGKREGWANPLVVAVLAAAVAAGGNAVVSYVEGEQSRELEALQAKETRALEETRAEYARIQAMLETNDPDTAAENLRFLVEIGLVSNEEMRARLANFLEKRAPGEGPVLARSSTDENERSGREVLAVALEPLISMKLAFSGLCDSVSPETILAQEDALNVCLMRFLAANASEVQEVKRKAPDALLEWIDAAALPPDWRLRAGLE